MSQLSSMGNNEEEACKLGLGLGEQYHAASLSTPTKNDHDHGKKMKEPLVCLRLQLCKFELFPENDHDDTDHTVSLEGNLSSKRMKKFHDDDQEDHVAISGSKKNEKNIINGGGTNRKKLKLTKEQTTYLEARFKFNTSLNLAQKQELTEQLNLKPRQVQVWFQNRRARTKVKQTEEDRELLKKYYESLDQENRRLRKELQELRSMNAEHCKAYFVSMSQEDEQIGEKSYKLRLILSASGVNGL